MLHPNDGNAPIQAGISGPNNWSAEHESHLLKATPIKNADIPRGTTINQSVKPLDQLYNTQDLMEVKKSRKRTLEQAVFTKKILKKI